MKDLKNDLKNKTIRTLYLFYGDEGYLKKHYEKALIHAVVTGAQDMNLSYFEEKEATAAAISDTAETVPFLSDKRILVMRNSGLFEAGRKEETEKMEDFFTRIPETACLVFVEDAVDKRLKIFKALQKEGLAVEFQTPSEKELATWVHKILKSEKLQIETSAVYYLIRCGGGKMQPIFTELQKLIAYKESGEVISIADLDSIVTKTLEAKIFDLVDAIGRKEITRALTLYKGLLINKEHPIMILGMISRQFRFIYQAKHLQLQGLSVNQIIEAMGQRSFVVRECLEEGQNFTMDVLYQALQDCLSTDVAIKSGKVEAALGVELLIADYGI